LGVINLNLGCFNIEAAFFILITSCIAAVQLCLRRTLVLVNREWTIFQVYDSHLRPVIMMNKETNVQVSDTTGGARSTKAGYTKI